MRRTNPLLIALSLFLAACQQRASPPAASSPGAAPAAMPASILPTPVKPADALASHNTNWTGVVADVMEFRRKGNVLTAIVRLRNNLTSIGLVQFNYREAYLLDEAGAKKYEVLKDEKDGYIAATPGGSVTKGISGGESLTLWMKFPAPALEVKTATLAIPETPPFEDLAIQDQ